MSAPRSFESLSSPDNRSTPLSLSQAKVLLALKAHRFSKSREHFGNEKSFYFPAQAIGQSVYQFKKTVKQNSSQDRNESNWLTIKTPMILPEFLPRSIALSVVAGEFYRFDIGNTQPKYRSLVEEETALLTKMIRESEFADFFEYLSSRVSSFSNETNLTMNRFLEGMGRVILTKWLYAEDDAHFGNFLVNKDNYLIGIDNNKCFYPVTHKFHMQLREVKALTVDIDNPSIKLKPICHLGKNLYIVEGLSSSDMGEMHQEDYNNLPVTRHHLAYNWQFITPQVKLFYSKNLAQDKRFLNEKYFTTFKILTTAFVKDLLVDIHAQDQDRQETKNFVSGRIKKLAIIASNSDGIHSYLFENGIVILNVIIYEMNDFFNDNKHYQAESEQEQQVLWEFFYKQVIQEFSKLMVDLSFIGLTEQQQKSVELYANNIKKNGQAEIKLVHAFYKAQLMNYHANLAEVKIMPVKQASTTIETAELNPITADASESALPPVTDETQENNPKRRKFGL
jgi:hypothetical protein